MLSSLSLSVQVSRIDFLHPTSSEKIKLRFWYLKNPNYPIEVEKIKKDDIDTVDPCLSNAFK